MNSLALAAALCSTIADVQAFDDALYPDWSGGWTRVRVDKYGRWDPSKPRGLGQEAPLTPEYQALYEASLADQKHGGQGVNPGYRCRPHGMPRIMNANHPLIFAITPETTYIFRDIANQSRRIYTDGRDWPDNLQHSSNGYSIGKWLDADNDGRFDTLEIETRNFKGPRVYEASGIPLHLDNESVVHERIALDKANKDLLRYEITTADHALTRPWTVLKTFRRERNILWSEDQCNENNNHVVVGKEFYFLSGDGYLMPTRKDQPPPDTRYFKTGR